MALGVVGAVAGARVRDTAGVVTCNVAGAGVVAGAGTRDVTRVGAGAESVAVVSAVGGAVDGAVAGGTAVDDVE